MNKFISKTKLMNFRNKNVYNDGDSNLFSYHYFNNCSFSKNNLIYKINFRKKSNFRSKTSKTFEQKSKNKTYIINFDNYTINEYNKPFITYHGGN